MIAHVFIDEYGSPSLEIEKDGVTPYFIYTGVVIEQSNLGLAAEIHNQIVNSYFGGTHIKSSNIPNNDKGHVKRIKILSDLAKLNHYVVALVVDKSKINNNGGLAYRESFYKFFNNLFSTHFFEKYEEYHLHLDKLGWPKFQQSLRNYMTEHGSGRTLFANNTFDLKDDITEEPLIQVADFYAGCIGKYYCGKLIKNQAEAIHNQIRTHLSIDWFPKEYISYLGASSFNSEEFNREILDIAITTANQYLQKESDPIGCEIVKILLQEAQLNPLRHISSNEIKKKILSLNLKIGDPITAIAQLRDKGVFVISPLGKKGYKLPCNEHEIAEFFDRLSSQVIPYIQRGQILHQILVEQSIGKYNILKKDEYSLLSSLIDVVTHKQFV